MVENDSEEALHFKDRGREVVLRTVEFKAVSEGSVASTRGRGTPAMNLEDPFADRGGYY